jgi:hypothetical protein
LTSEKKKSTPNPQSKAPRAPKSKEPESPRDDELSVAFNAFADSMLRLRGRVRFATVSAAFRHEFPTLASEERVLNSTLGRLVQTWHKSQTGADLNRTRSGVILGLSLVNPSYTKADLRSLRAAQVLFEPGMRKKFDTLGLSVEAPPSRRGGERERTQPSRRRDADPAAAALAAAAGAVAAAGAGSQRRERQAAPVRDGAEEGKGGGGWRAMVVKNQDGKVARTHPPRPPRSTHPRSSGRHPRHSSAVAANASTHPAATSSTASSSRAPPPPARRPCA